MGDSVHTWSLSCPVSSSVLQPCEERLSSRFSYRQPLDSRNRTLDRFSSSQSSKWWWSKRLLGRPCTWIAWWVTWTSCQHRCQSARMVPHTSARCSPWSQVYTCRAPERRQCWFSHRAWSNRVQVQALHHPLLLLSVLTFVKNSCSICVHFYQASSIVNPLIG